jgi:hypothetical protein
MPALASFRRLAAHVATARRALALAALVALTTAATACGGSDKKDPAGPGNEQDVAGNYSLTKVDGSELPAVLFDGQMDFGGEIVDVTIVVTDGSIDLAENGTYFGSLDVAIEIAGESDEAQIPSSGTYTRNGSTITFNPSDAEQESFTARVSNGALTATIDPIGIEEPASYVFSK